MVCMSRSKVRLAKGVLGLVESGLEGWYRATKFAT